MLDHHDLDALIVGAGFGGIYHLHQLRKRGFSVKIFEAGSDIGGVWHWNRYPGVRADSDFTVYQFLMEDLWKGFIWPERFAAGKDILEYLHYVDKALNLRQDITFNIRVTSAQFDTAADRWTVITDTGIKVHPRFFILCTGYASKPKIPPIKGLDTFKGIYCHTGSFFSEGRAVLIGKRVGIIGTGASGIQVIQETGPLASHLTVFQRTPQFALPMRQYSIDKEKQKLLMEGNDPLLPHILRRRFQTFIGAYYDTQPKSLKDVSHEERILTFEELWAKGGFHSYLGTYKDVYVDRSANDLLYAFWRKKVLARINDPLKQEKLAPAEP